MSKEIERKFLIKNEDWRKNAKGSYLKQGYLSSETNRTVRVRIKGDKGFLTIKTATIGISRFEYEYEIPLNDAKELLDLCPRPIIEKTRYEVPYENNLWEVDVFEGENKGLIFAEVELANEDQKVSIPDWIGEEITDNPAYRNSNLAKRPFSKW